MKIKLNINLYKEVWSLSDLEPNELNKKFTFNKTATETNENSENDYNIKRSNADLSSSKSSLRLLGSIPGLGILGGLLKLAEDSSEILFFLHLRLKIYYTSKVSMVNGKEKSFIQNHSMFID